MAAAFAVLTEFRKNAFCELGVQERDFLCVCSDFRLFIDEADSRIFGFREVFHNGIAVESYVVDAAKGILFQEFGDGAVGRSRFEKFDMNSADIEERRLDFLFGDFFRCLRI